jgi:FkbM family methyltransferase
MEASLLNGMKVVVPWNDHVGGHIFREGFYEWDSLATIERLLEPGMVFVDVGAHIGQYTLVASPIVGASGQVHSFEPDPETFSLLARNVATNQLRNVHLNLTALFSGKGRKSLFLSSVIDIGSNSLVAPATPSGQSCDVDCVALDTYLRSKGLSRVDVMKIDVEGAEYDVLRGAVDLLTGDRGPVILIEFEEERQRAFGYSCAKLADLLRSYGYCLFRVGDPLQEYVPKIDDPYSFNVLAVPRPQRGAIMARLGALSATE